ncbi:potassium transporter TrkA [Haloarcula sp. S1AR25-5A]|uniref:Potassium transporter TrkA n=1 Tax=Haloarcula terrestris TaxID=2950533 RepID=A0AAE4EYW9_9EURY|nr:TrkA C-terminal domain-containing protein [Haloarcula terrestris]MDS0222447.1 potassium transporter TrkA [Haloarcula terrestris]
MDVSETDLPGVGKKHEIALRSGDHAVILTHNSGKRELMRKEDVDADPERLLELTDQESRVLGTVLEGAYFQPIESDDDETLFADDLMIDWITILESSPVIGDTVSATAPDNITVLAVYQNEELIADSFTETAFQAGDTVIVAGTQDAVGRFDAQVSSNQ